MDTLTLVLIAVVGSPVLLAIYTSWDRRQSEKRQDAREKQKADEVKEVQRVAAETAKQAQEDAKRAQDAQAQAADQVLQAAKLLVQSGAVTTKSLEFLQKTANDTNLISKNTHQIVNSQNTDLLVDSASQARTIANLLGILARQNPDDLIAKEAMKQAETIAISKEERATKSLQAAKILEETESGSEKSAVQNIKKEV